MARHVRGGPAPGPGEILLLRKYVAFLDFSFFEIPTVYILRGGGDPKTGGKKSMGKRTKEVKQKKQHLLLSPPPPSTG